MQITHHSIPPKASSAAPLHSPTLLKALSHGSRKNRGFALAGSPGFTVLDFRGGTLDVSGSVCSGLFFQGRFHGAGFELVVVVFHSSLGFTDTRTCRG